MIIITDTAQKYLTTLLAKQKSGTQIRVLVLNPGTPIAECSLSYCPIDTVTKKDIKLEFDQFCVYVDQLSTSYLEDALIDCVLDELGTQLIIQAPHLIEKIDSNTPLLERVNQIILSCINPQLANHGGKVTLITITEDMFAIIQFSGGCNGCSMVSYTLKEHIEKKLLQLFPELKGVKDLTQHNHSQYSFY
ncbi:Fe-S biogenesis protein NfuA [Candidatus Palibaumannia cicadellinicola]|uniref:Fe/S biogenesis protein NfuA n=1 Tax=Baumannia cicadellinicola subsp. Homalodisca coagulata TaxID=374463 RepID=NFUA_BAUCH|nr:Fe-S biogenesis protein NfuA [Candidatus Baumannia cicadellinicola]Q1LSZ3.1 RecName: Full=Fe/S biogenesis protein NfuA [Baumannia cicadellinicola str. Hc (Homalodisca coagulata)]ABF13908.1 yhgI protein [Baumannia cicadellinicola str. Hc (Homalodisca coagulata)]MBS0032762.1 Fe-S biogenesis protein NfuA [Candidatus Baumannia cicadellinicola]MCJ7462041.1 Fe-S biogenesis protein NfuA [Candidatus Baumannia cicadellinicola]MCJ7463068.1 Fe-S biogenesis protein NfuA [Candidatus Baumannia cicadellin